MKLKVNDVVQFNMDHAWAGVIGFVSNVDNDDVIVNIVFPKGMLKAIRTKEKNLLYIGKLPLAIGTPIEQQEL